MSKIADHVRSTVVTICPCPTCQAIRHGVVPVAPDTVPDPRKMEPGDCQRVLVDVWDAMKKAEGNS